MIAWGWKINKYMIQGSDHVIAKPRWFQGACEWCDSGLIYRPDSYLFHILLLFSIQEIHL